MTRRNEDYDEFCDPDNPKLIKYDDVVAAAQKIKNYIVHTPCMAAHTQQEFGIYIHYKLEMIQKTGSFKERGALNVLLNLTKDKKKIGIVIASTGNEAESFAYYAKTMNIPLTIILPVTMPTSKLGTCMSLGAKVLLQGANLSEAQKYARSYAREKGLTFINARDHPQILAGNATVGLEIMEQTPFADAVLVPMGSGGLAAGVACVVKQLKPSCLVYGVQAECMPGFFQSLEQQQPLSNLPLLDSVAGDALAVTNIGVNAFHNAKALLDKVILVKEDWIARAMLHLVEREKFIVEGAGACPLAAIIGNLVPELKTKNIVCILTGGNIECLIFNRSLERGKAAEGRLIKFRVGVLNKPGAKRALMELIAGAGYNVLCFIIDNIWVEGDTCYSQVKIVCETKGFEASLELKRLVEKHYPETAVFLSEPFNDKRICPCYVKKKSSLHML